MQISSQHSTAVRLGLGRTGRGQGIVCGIRGSLLSILPAGEAGQFWELEMDSVRREGWVVGD